MEKDKEKNFISIVIYVYNCENLIQNFLEVIDREISSHFCSYEFICINDASTDRSIDKIREYAKQDRSPVISIINMSYYQGIEASMNAGIDLAIGDFVYEFDTVYVDYNPELVYQVYQKTQAGFDIVCAANRKAKRLATSLFYYIFNSNFNQSNFLQNETFRVLSRRCINRIKGMSVTSVYRKAMYASCGLKNEVICYSPLRIGNTMKTKKINYARKNLAINSLLLFTDVAYKFALICSGLLLVIFLGAGAYQLVTDYKAIFPLEYVLIIGQSGIFLLGAVLIRYLTLLVDLVFRKQNYIYDSIEKLIK